MDTPGHETATESSLLTIDEAGARLRVGRRTVYRLIERQQLAAVRIGRRTRIPAEAVSEFVARGGAA